jgi:hypothetical protein
MLCRRVGARLPASRRTALQSSSSVAHGRRLREPSATAPAGIPFVDGRCRVLTSTTSSASYFMPLSREKRHDPEPIRYVRRDGRLLSAPHVEDLDRLLRLPEKTREAYEIATIGEALRVGSRRGAEVQIRSERRLTTHRSRLAVLAAPAS